MCRRGERSAHDVCQESCRGPDADSPHARQDRAKRVRHYKSLNLFRDFFALPAQSRQLLRQARQDNTCGLSTRYHDRLLGQSPNDLGSPNLSRARSKFRESVGQLLLANGRELRG